jgi:hypothetical protein
LRGHVFTAERRPVFLSLLARSLPSSVVPPQLTSLPLLLLLLHGDVEEFLLVVVFTAKGKYLAHGIQQPIPKLQILNFFNKFVCLFVLILNCCCSAAPWRR